MGLDALVSDNRYFDVLPKDVSKGPSLLRLLTHLGVANERCLVAGDTLNDLSMLSLGLPAVAVGNSEPALIGRRWRGRSTCISPPATAPRASPRPSRPRRPASRRGLRKEPPMSSDLVIVYHRQPYEEVEENGRIVLKENSSPNGIVPTLKSFFGAVDHGAWVAWKLAEDPANPDFEQVIEIDDAYGKYSVSRLPLSAHQVREFYHVTSKEAFWPILHSFKDATITTPWTGPISAR
jgi:hypothetical protein